MLKDDIVKIILQIYNYVDIFEGHDPTRIYAYARIYEHYDPIQSICFKSEAIQLISEIVELIVNKNKEKCSPIVSEKFLEQHIVKIIISSILDKEKNKNNLLYNLITGFIKNLKVKKYLCYVPIFRVKLIKEYKYPNFKLLPINDNLVNYFKGIGIEYEGLLGHTINSISEKEIDCCLAEVNLSCIDEKLAEQESFRIIDNFLNILRVFNKGPSTIQGLSQKTNQIIVCDVDEDKQLSANISIIDTDFAFPSFHYDEFSRNFPIKEIIEYRSNNPIFRNIRNSMIWLGHSNIVYHDYEILIMRITALESLLLKENENSGGKNLISERAAFLLGTNFEERDKIFKLISKSYELRSKVVHGERDIVISGILLENIKQYCIDMILEIVKLDKFQSITDLNNHIYSIKFGLA